jgi:hypothetical protein
MVVDAVCIDIRPQHPMQEGNESCKTASDAPPVGQLQR